jgi:hypothetical protein
MVFVSSTGDIIHNCFDSVINKLTNKTTSLASIHSVNACYITFEVQAANPLVLFQNSEGGRTQFLCSSSLEHVPRFVT